MYPCVLSKGFHNLVYLIIDIDAQNTESAETWHLMEAEAGRKANKGQNKGRIWAMIMQLSADPSHEYGSCGGDVSGCVWCMHILYLTACVCLCAHIIYTTNYACPPTSALSLTCACIAISNPLVLRHLRVSICLWPAPTGAKKSIN